MGADQRQDLRGGAEKGHGINKAQQPENDKARQPVTIGGTRR